eukprot:TRINITY_DN218_c0_g1_i14.p1 TRINITY_DN218_c0_g1~~TRINITY_DN218_c0_g1_i14.p1  ORF type:complete len:194 (+),score=16.15 TRINITY_DN218_c0_g1_i14:224-805(+)
MDPAAGMWRRQEVHLALVLAQGASPIRQCHSEEVDRLAWRCLLHAPSLADALELGARSPPGTREGKPVVSAAYSSGSDQNPLFQKRSRLPYNELCTHLPEPCFKGCLRKTLEVLVDLLASYEAMMMWHHPEEVEIASPPFVTLVKAQLFWAFLWTQNFSRIQYTNGDFLLCMRPEAWEHAKPARTFCHWSYSH